MAIFRDISLIDIFDIALVSYGIYRALLFIEGTRAFNLLKGLGIILVLLVITKDLDFNTVSWALSNALPTGFLALVVIFQPELRRALEDIGKGRFLSEQTVNEDSIPEMAEEVCKTIEACAKKRIGALIVFEQEIGLKDFIENGVQLNSSITSELLSTVFMPFTPCMTVPSSFRGRRSPRPAVFCRQPATTVKWQKNLARAIVRPLV